MPATRLFEPLIDKKRAQLPAVQTILRRASSQATTALALVVVELRKSGSSSLGRH